MSQVIKIEHESSVSEVRRIGNIVADEEGLNSDARGRLALVISEAASNLLKHAGGGELHVAGLSKRQQAGVEILAIDRGPGIENIDRVMTDGFSTAGTYGTGLGAIRRAAQAFDIYSELNHGTIVMAQVGGSLSLNETPAVVGAAEKPLWSEQVSGDAWSVRLNPSGIAVVLADGLGHGLQAADASGEVIAAFDRYGQLDPVAFLERAHPSLRATRGAAVSIAAINFESREVCYAGVGNIGGWLISAEKSQSMISHNGTLGLAVRRFQEFRYVWPDSGFLVMHSDGLITNWQVSPQARNRHPSVIAALLYRDSSRSRDDVCVVVVKQRERSS